MDDRSPTLTVSGFVRETIQAEFGSERACLDEARKAPRKLPLLSEDDERSIPLVRRDETITTIAGQSQVIRKVTDPINTHRVYALIDNLSGLGSTELELLSTTHFVAQRRSGSEDDLVGAELLPSREATSAAGLLRARSCAPWLDEPFLVRLWKTLVLCARTAQRADAPRARARPGEHVGFELASLNRGRSDAGGELLPPPSFAVEALEHPAQQLGVAWLRMGMPKRTLVAIPS